MNILIFDTETTGLPNWKEPSDDPSQPYVVEVAADLVNVETGQTFAALDFLINNGVPIPEDVIAIHGITNEMVEAEGILPADAFSQFLAFVSQADLIVGHQVGFDVRMMRIMGARVTGEKWECPIPTFCTMKESHAFVKTLPAPPAGWKWPPSLTDTVKHLLGEDFAEAHRARPDADASRRIYFHLRSNAQ